VKEAVMPQQKYQLNVINDIGIDSLDLDPENPRFAGALGHNPSQKRILDYIAENIGLKDLLSSMSHSGYYVSAPLIGVPKNGRITIVEGNRRLATALLLLGDERASSQVNRAKSHPLQAAREKLEILPVLLVESREKVLPYLGMAHIVGNKTWDSHAKAAWAVNVLDQKLYPGGLAQIAEEIGDTNRTLERMVEAYRFVTQLQSSGRFVPESSVKKGRGSAVYPFSWVYTALQFASIREYLAFDTERGELITGRDPIPVSKLDEAAELLTWMFGNKDKNIEPRLDDSREIPDLAAAVTNRSQLSHMRLGMSLAESREAVRPPTARLTDGLVAAEEALKTVLGVLATTVSSLSPEELESLIAGARRVRDLANHISKTLKAAEDRDSATA
jgi:hypothetical protein